MRASGERARAEAALNAVRKLVRDCPEVFGSGLTVEDDHYAVQVMATAPVTILPAYVGGVRIVQRIGPRPRPWRI
jgi:hypothetical protein